MYLLEIKIAVCSEEGSKRSRKNFIQGLNETVGTFPQVQRRLGCITFARGTTGRRSFIIEELNF
jgi:hypothetical protein